MTRYSNDSLQFHGLLNGVAMPSAVTLRGLSNLAHNPGITTIGPDSGSTYNEVRFIGEARSEVLGTVAAIRSLLDTLSLLGTNCMTDDGTHPGVRAFLQSHNACSPNGRDAGSLHRRITVAKSQILITQLGGTKGSSASAQVRVIELSTDGNTDPDLIVSNAALPTPVIDDEEFVVCPPTIASIVVPQDHFMGWSLETGINMTVIIPANGIYPIAVDLQKTVPRWTVQHDDPTLLDAAKIPRKGIECTLANTTFPLQKRSPFGGLVAAATTAHVKISAAGFAHVVKHYDASGQATGTGEIVVEGTEGVGGVPLSVATGVAL